MKWFVLVELFTGSKIRKILYHSLDCIIFLNAKIDTISGFFLKKIKKNLFQLLDHRFFIMFNVREMFFESDSNIGDKMLFFANFR